jgi:hypothetical protein
MLIKSFLAARKVLEPRCGKFRQKNSFVCVLGCDMKRTQRWLASNRSGPGGEQKDIVTFHE